MAELFYDASEGGYLDGVNGDVEGNGIVGGKGMAIAGFCGCGGRGRRGCEIDVVGGHCRGWLRSCFGESFRDCGIVSVKNSVSLQGYSSAHPEAEELADLYEVAQITLPYVPGIY